MTRFHSSAAIVFLFVFGILSPLALTTSGAGAAPVRTPQNIRIASVLEPVFQEIAAVSPTFNAQCARIASATYVRVTVNPVMASSTTSRGTARTTMRRFASGALLATVDMPVPLTTLEYAELFGHEFEHIVEQIERVDLDALVLVRHGATRLSDGAFETARAQKAGRAIAREAERTRAADMPPAPPLPQGGVLSPAQFSPATPVNRLKQR
jgi:hypothetical protein